ncbi:c-type cytochrome [Falsiroseomonas oryzae]|uniref:c-type cytochrome n=1 Tax=Falsiroseomonas oryzae TaxID=2766473 RepID=UPI0022EAE494|nr:c-type cytochrome [Roseomonas sp. MO-31]
MTRVRKSLLAAACGAALATAGAAQAQQPSRGQEAYTLACAQCHGAQGRGDGPMRQFLTVPPSDLTTLRQRDPNREFPFYRVFLVVDGRTQVPAHGTREMPAWGAVFSVEAGNRFGEFGRETYIRGRIVELVSHIETLQR